MSSSGTFDTVSLNSSPKSSISASSLKNNDYYTLPPAPSPNQSPSPIQSPHSRSSTRSRSSEGHVKEKNKGIKEQISDQTKELRKAIKTSGKNIKRFSKSIFNRFILKRQPLLGKNVTKSHKGGKKRNTRKKRRR
tara:strand:+ start:3647 stop:4051 length:405 start_codon:yes stop_codon:yes gene_type:complete